MKPKRKMNNGCFGYMGKVHGIKGKDFGYLGAVHGKKGGRPKRKIKSKPKSEQE